MSDYEKNKVLRLPIDKIDMEVFCKEIEQRYFELQGKVINAKDDLAWYVEEAFPDLFGYQDKGKFTIAPTYPRGFIDYVLDSTWGDDCGDWGKVRELYPTEKTKYLPVFQKILPRLENLDDVRLVEYCYYNGCEAPDYYDLKDDPFYAEV